MNKLASIILSLSLAGCSSSASPGGEPPKCAPGASVPFTIVVNEIMASNAVTATDEQGHGSDWIELYNYGGAPVPLCGYGVTDDLLKPNKGYLAADAIVAPFAHLLVWMGGKDDAELPNHMPFRLSQAGGAIGIAAADGTFVARLTYGAQSTDLSASREPDGSDSWVIEWHATPGAPNPAGTGAPIGADDPTAAPEMVPAAGDMTDIIMGYDETPAIGLRVEPNQVAKLESDPRTYVPGYLIYDGREYGPVGVKLKGHNSFQPFDQKPSFRINIDEYVGNAKFFDRDDLTFNNMSDDFSMMHERLAYLVARQLGPASRANHAVLTVNNQPYGLYANVETVKHHMIARWFDDAMGPLFGATDVDFAAPYIDDFEHESGPDDRSALAGLAAALTNPNADAAIAAASAYVDMDGFLDFWAMEAVIGQFDAFPYSNPGDDYFVYVDPATNKIRFLPWGMDETFYSGSHDVGLVSSLLATTCAASPSCHQSFVARVWMVFHLTEDMDLLGERERVIAQIAPHVAADKRKAYSDAEVTEYQMQLYWFIKGRRVNLETMLGPEPL